MNASGVHVHCMTPSADARSHQGPSSPHSAVDVGSGVFGSARVGGGDDDDHGSVNQEDVVVAIVAPHELEVADCDLDVASGLDATAEEVSSGGKQRRLRFNHIVDGSKPNAHVGVFVSLAPAHCHRFG